MIGEKQALQCLRQHRFFSIEWEHRGQRNITYFLKRILRYIATNPDDYFTK